MKVIWQASSHDKPHSASFDTKTEAEAKVKEMLEMGRQFKAIWVIVPHIEKVANNGTY